MGSGAIGGIASRYTEFVSKPPIRTPTSGVPHVLALDYGRARVGVAVAPLDSAVAQALSTLVRVNRNEDMRRLREIIREYSVRQIVVGLPLRLDGTRGEMAEEAARFAQRVHQQFRLPVELVDERLTSWEAERQLEENQGRVLHTASGKKKKANARPDVDAMAAAIILKEYLDRQRMGPEPASKAVASNP